MTKIIKGTTGMSTNFHFGILRIITIFLILMFECIKTNAQNYSWVNQIGSTRTDYSEGVAIDASGNVYTVGYFSGNVSYPALTNAGNSDVIFAKYNTAGVLQWAKTIGGVDSDMGFDIAVDASLNIYITGSFSGTVDFDPSAAVVNLTSTGSTDIFFGKYTSNGDYVWAKSIGTAFVNRGYGIKVDASGGVYVSGYFGGIVDFDPSAATANLTSAGANDAFFAKYDNNGSYLWAKSLGGASFDVVRGIGLDVFGNLYLTGIFNLTTDFDPSAATANLTSLGNDDVFFAKYDRNGNYVWAKALGGTSYDNCNDIALDVLGNVYITGNFRGTVDFDPSASTTNLTSNGVTGEAFFAKYDNNGNYMWAKAASGVSHTSGLGIALDVSGNVYVTGYFYSTVDFDPSSSTATLTSVGNSDVFFAKYDNSGNYVWAKAIGGTGFDEGRDIALDAFGNAHITGYFQNTVDFDPSSSISNLTSNLTSSDIFIAKYTQIILPVILTHFTATNQEKNVLLQWATKTEINSQAFEIQRSTDGKEFKAISTVAAKGVASEYKFADSPPIEGLGVVYYRLKMIDKDGKYSYSEVRQLSILNSPSSIKIYPNPVKGSNLKVDFGEEIKAKTNYIITTVEGRVLQQGYINNQQETISIQNLSKGMYIIKLANKQKQFVVL